MWECGLKHTINSLAITGDKSLLMWECGLKRNKMEEEQDALDVTPYVGVWIETVKLSYEGRDSIVTPYVGVWIETYKTLQRIYPKMSLLMWECGLKPLCSSIKRILPRHSLCGSVD